MSPPGKLSEIIRAGNANSSGKRDFSRMAIGCDRCARQCWAAWFVSEIKMAVSSLFGRGRLAAETEEEYKCRKVSFHFIEE
ncbi:hypothetical protein Ser39006_005170 [Prodigiosinella confusarubida]|uniref:Uncharacterized protein n=1 Tax=Serratia sp. (strain ATCC 39006) TaxID=104623 RepID=A0A2I5TG74_SERS3|nr:hypothetical protein Ser39006_005170 [Serratia sp. ATCC 39006]